MQAVQFLITTLFGLYLMVALLRVWLQLAKADFYNPISQFVVKATNPVLVPLRRVIPGFGGIDCAGIVLALLVVFTEYSVLFLLFENTYPVTQIVILSTISLIKEVFQLVFWIMIIRAILSWVSQGYNPIEALLHQLTEPLLVPIRKIIPPIGGLDLSMIVFLVGLQFLQILFQELLSGIF